MPFTAYFAVTGPLLLAALLAFSACLEPENAPAPAEFLGIRAAKAEPANVIADRDAGSRDDDESLFEMLQRRPLIR